MDFREFLILSTISFSLLYTGYILLLQDKVSYNNSRFLILSIVFMSILFPLINFHFLINSSVLQDNTTAIFATNILNISEVNNFSNKINQQVNMNEILIGVYSIGTIVLLGFFIYNLFKIYKLYINATKTNYDQFLLLRSGEIEMPFSFFNLLFIPSYLSESKDLNYILAHEIIHIEQKHSIDIIIVELFRIVFWFNPLSWLFKKRLLLVHEHLADSGVLQTGLDKNNYLIVLSNQITGSEYFSLKSNINNSIKKRIIMISKKRNVLQKHTILFRFIAISISVIIISGIFNAQANITQKSNCEAVDISKPEWKELKHYSVSKNDLLWHNNSIKFIYKYYGIDIDIRTVYFAVDYIPVKEDPFTIKISGSQFTPLLINIIKSSKKGDKFYFKDVTYIDKNGKSEQLELNLFEINGK